MIRHGRESLNEIIDQFIDNARQATDERDTEGVKSATEGRDRIEAYAAEARDLLLVAPRARVMRYFAAVAIVVQLLQFQVAIRWIATSPHDGGLAASQVAGKSVALLVVCLLVASDPRRFGPLAWLMLIAESISILLLGVTAIADLATRPSGTVVLWPDHAPAGATWSFAVQSGLGFLSSCALAWGWARIVRARHGLRCLSRTEYAIVRAVAEAAAPSQAIPAAQLAGAVDRYISLLRAPQRWVLRRAITGAGIGPLLRGQLPLPLMEADSRRAQLDHNAERVRIHTVLSLVRLAYYEDPRGQLAIQRIPQGRHGTGSSKAPFPRLEQHTGGELTAEIVVVGSGAAGSTLAIELATRGHEVLLLEHGDAGPEEPRDLKAEDLARHYSDGGVSLVAGISGLVGEAVALGGGSALSAGRASVPPPGFLEEWEAIGAPGPIADLAAALASVQERLPARRDDIPPQEDVVARGLKALALKAAPVEPGAGYDLALTRALAAAQAKSPQRLRIFTRFAVDRISHQDGTATGVSGRLDGRQTSVRAETIVICAGVGRSAQLLRASGLGEAASRQPVSLIVGAQMLGKFEDPIGTEGSSELWSLAEDDVMFASELYPPVTQALLLQAPRERHDYLMRRWRDLAAITALTRATSGGLGVANFPLSEDDGLRLRRALALAGRVLFAAGAELVIAPTVPYREFASPEALSALHEDGLEHPRLVISTAYGFGGIPMGSSPAENVIGYDFRVHGLRNLFVCDGSVVPRNPGVDPQLTIAALALRAVESIAGAELDTPFRGDTIRRAAGDGPSHHAVVKVVGVGDAGTNAVSGMVHAGVRGVEFIAANTDAQALAMLDADVKLNIGRELTEGLGTSADLEVSLDAATESRNKIKEVLKGADVVFVTAGEGGRIGTAAAPVIAEIARGQIGALTVGLVTRPFDFEGRERQRQADDGIRRLHEVVDTLIVIPNEKLGATVERRTSVTEAFREADNVLRQGVQGITDLITTSGPNKPVFADVRAIMTDAGTALMGIGIGSGENRAAAAAKAAISSPLLEQSIDRATRIVLNITGGHDLGLFEVNEVANIVQDAADPNADIIFGAVIDEAQGEEVRVTVFATGFEPRRTGPGRSSWLPPSSSERRRPGPVPDRRA